MNVDYSVYPDQELVSLDTDQHKADYLHRVCAAWDFGILPTEDTFKLFANWEHIFRKYPCYSSPAYQAFQEYFGWELLDDPNVYYGLKDYWKEVDHIDGRCYPDPCEHII